MVCYLWYILLWYIYPGSQELSYISDVSSMNVQCRLMNNNNMLCFNSLCMWMDLYIGVSLSAGIATSIMFVVASIMNTRR